MLLTGCIGRYDEQLTADELFAITKKNKPIILTNIMSKWPQMDLTWHDNFTGGHTVNSVPQTLLDQYKQQWTFPFTDLLEFTPDSAW